MSHRSRPSVQSHEMSFRAKEKRAVENAIHGEAPFIVVVYGPPGVGKSTLISSLVKNTHKNHLIGPITSSIKGFRVQFLECDIGAIHSMIDCAKSANLVLVCIDGSRSCLNMETLEFFNILKVVGSPRIMGILTHLDDIKLVLKKGDLDDELVLKKGEEKFRDRIEKLKLAFYKEISKTAKVFEFSGLNSQGRYKEREVQNLRLLISKRLTRPTSNPYPYVLADDLEDVTSPEKIEKDKKCRNIALYGYLHGCNLNKGMKVHISGVGDYNLAGVIALPDPFPLPPAAQKKELYYAPMSEKYHLSCTNKGSNTKKPGDEYGTGTYLRLEIHNVPYQMFECFDPRHPLLIGGIGYDEVTLGYMQARLKLPENLLKTRDPIMVSIGWRCYQTIPIYCNEYPDSKDRHRMLKRTPKEKHCLARFWGPLVPAYTGFFAFQPNNQAGSRIIGTSEVRDINPEAPIVEKTKLSGTPYKIKKKTAFIKGMFTSDLHIAEYEGSTVRTVSGIKGKVEKIDLKNKEEKKMSEQGIAKCRFEDLIGKSDKVFVRGWKEVEVPNFYALLKTALQPRQ